MIKRILVVVFITLCTTTTLSMVYDLIVNGPFKHVYGGKWLEYNHNPCTCTF